MRCAHSGRVFTPYPKKGTMYYGARCPIGCPHETASFNVNFLEEEIGKLISKLKFTEEELIEIEARTRTDLAVFEHKRLDGLEKNDRRKRKLREDLTYLRTNKLTLLKTGAYSPEDFLQEENKLNSELLIIQNDEQASDISMHEVVKDLVVLSELLKDAELYYSFAETEEREQIARVIFSELSLSENTLKYQCKNGFKALESRFTDSHDPNDTRFKTLCRVLCEAGKHYLQL